jgi:hypothetical protein
LIAIFLWSGASQTALSQDPSLDAIATNKADATAYRILFRQVANFKKISDDSKADGEDKSYMRGILPRRLELTDTDAESLERISVACAAEMAVVQAKITRAVAAFNQQYALDKAAGKKVTNPPVALSDLQAQEDTIVLHYRDTLRSAMKETDFQKAQTEIRKTFGKTLYSKNISSDTIDPQGRGSE